MPTLIWEFFSCGKLPNYIFKKIVFCGKFFFIIIIKKSSENNGIKILSRIVSNLSTGLGSPCVTGDPDSPPVDSVFPWTSQ